MSVIINVEDEFCPNNRCLGCYFREHVSDYSYEYICSLTDKQAIVDKYVDSGNGKHPACPLRSIAGLKEAFKDFFYNECGTREEYERMSENINIIIDNYCGSQDIDAREEN